MATPPYTVTVLGPLALLVIFISPSFSTRLIYQHPLWKYHTRGIITRPPSAELREDQKDEDSLPPYERLDLILECMHSYQFSINDIVDLGIERDEVLKVQQLFHRSEFKRYQFCPIIKLKGKSFGFGHRVPILKDITIEIN